MFQEQLFELLQDIICQTLFASQGLGSWAMKKGTVSSDKLTIIIQQSFSSFSLAVRLNNYLRRMVCSCIICVLLKMKQQQ